MRLQGLASRYLWRHDYNTSFYQVSQQLASPVLKSTVSSTIINRNDTTYPSTADYFKIKSTCARSSLLSHHPPVGPLCRCVAAKASHNFRH